LETEKYEDGLRYVDDLIKINEAELNEEERNLFAMMYRYHIDQKRSAWRILYTQEEKEKSSKTSYTNMLSEIRDNIEKEITSISERIIHLINDSIIRKVKTNEGKAFFFKIKGDYFRYLSEISYGETLTSAKKNALDHYKDSITYCTDLDPLNVTRLGNYLNFSVFQYEIMNNTSQAINIARQTLLEAANVLKIIGSEAIKNQDLNDSLSLIQILKENLTSWLQEQEETGGKNI